MKFGPRSCDGTGSPFGVSRNRTISQSPKYFSAEVAANLSRTVMYNRIDAPVSGEKPFTDYNRWRLLVNDGGRHTWHYLETDEECEKWPMNDVDKFWMGIPLVSVFFCLLIVY